MGRELWKVAPDSLVKTRRYCAAWAPIAIEGMEVGRIARLVVSTARLSAVEPPRMTSRFAATFCTARKLSDMSVERFFSFNS